MGEIHQNEPRKNKTEYNFNAFPTLQAASDNNKTSKDHIPRTSQNDSLSKACKKNNNSVINTQSSPNQRITMSLFSKQSNNCSTLNSIRLQNDRISCSKMEELVRESHNSLEAHRNGDSNMHNVLYPNTIQAIEQAVALKLPPNKGKDLLHSCKSEESLKRTKPKNIEKQLISIYKNPQILHNPNQLEKEKTLFNTSKLIKTFFHSDKME